MLEKHIEASGYTLTRMPRGRSSFVRVRAIAISSCPYSPAAGTTPHLLLIKIGLGDIRSML
jgi:hypothetical protein